MQLISVSACVFISTLNCFCFACSSALRFVIQRCCLNTSPVICRFFSAFDVADHGTRADTRSAKTMKLIINGDIAKALSVGRNSSVQKQTGHALLAGMRSPRKPATAPSPLSGVDDPIYRCHRAVPRCCVLETREAPSPNGTGARRGASLLLLRGGRLSWRF